MGSLVAFFTGIVLSLFTIQADRIYVVCYKTSDICYVYDQEENVYQVQESGSLLPLLSSAVPIVRSPVMHYIPVECDIYAEPLSMNCYQMDYMSICSFLSRMMADGYSLDIILQTPSMMEGYLRSSDMDYRFIAMSDGTFRIYARDSATFSGTIPYLTEE